MNFAKRFISVFMCLLMMVSLVFIASSSEIPTAAASQRLGDADSDSNVNIKDATLIQKYSASLVTLTNEQFTAADANSDKKVNVKDATAIQKHIAGIETGFAIGELVEIKFADSIRICLGSHPETLDPALDSSVDGASYILHAFSGLVGYELSAGGVPRLAPDCAEKFPEAVELEDGKVSYTFKLRDGLKWSDGSDLTAHDFVYAWNRAVSPELMADYAYMFEVIDGFEEATIGEGKLNVAASEDGRSLTVVLNSYVPYFFELCAFPTYMPVKKEVVEKRDDWTNDVSTCISNGPYKLTKHQHDRIVFEKNEYYHNADAIKTKKIICSFNESESSAYDQFKDGIYKFLDILPYDKIDDIKSKYPDEYEVVGQLGTYYISFNVNAGKLSMFTQKEQESIRKALSLLIDRNYICSEIVYSAKPASTFVAMGHTDADGATEFMDNANGGKGYYSVDENSYESNCHEAIELLRSVAKSSGKFAVNEDGTVVGFPVIKYITNEGSGHELIAEHMQWTYATYGIDMVIEVMEWNDFLNARWSGEYIFARNGWLSDYNDPISFLDMWTTNSSYNDCQFGKGSHSGYAGYSYNGKDGLTWAESYDELIAEIKSCKDSVKRYELMHKAEDMLMQTGAICPLYYYTDEYLHSSRLEDFFVSPLGYKCFMYAYYSYPQE